MTRLGAIVWFVLVLAAGFTTFKVKYAVQDLEDQLHRVRKETVAEQQEIRVLTAEWTYLNQPERLADLNRRFLGLVPIGAKQLQQKIADIPLRAPAAAPEVAVADNAAPGTPPPAGRLALAPVVLNPAPIPGSATSRQPDASGPSRDGLQPQGAALPVQLAKAGPSSGSRSLDALFAQIAESR